MKIREVLSMVLIMMCLVPCAAFSGDSAVSGQSSVSLKGEFNGLFDQIGKDFEKFGKEIRVEIDKAGKQINGDFEKIGKDLSRELDKAGKQLGTQLNTIGKSGAASPAAARTAAPSSQPVPVASTGIQGALDSLDKTLDGIVSFENTKTPSAILPGGPQTPDTGKAEGQIKEFIARLEAKIKEIKDKLAKGGSQAQATANTGLNKELSKVSGSIETTFKGQSKNFKSFEESLREFGAEFKKLGDNLKGEIETAGRSIGKEFDKAGADISNGFGKTVQNLGTELNKAFSGIEAAISGYTMVPGARPPFTSSTSPNPGAGKNNYCGQYAMTTVFNALGVNKDFEQVFKDTNPASIFTSPSTIESYLRKSGVAANMSQRNNTGDIKKQLDSGKPVLILVDCGGTPHWVAVVGYKTGSDGKATFRIADSVWGVRQSSGFAEMSEADLAKMWAKPLGSGPLGWLTNYENLMITVGDAGSANGNPLISMPSSTSVEDSLGRGVCDVVAGWKNRNVGQVLSGVGDSLAGLLGAVPNLAGKAIEKGSSALKNWGAQKKEEGGFFNKVLGTGASVLGSVGSVGGKVLETTGNVLTSVGQTVVNGAKKVGSWIKGLFS